MAQDVDVIIRDAGATTGTSAIGQLLGAQVTKEINAPGEGSFTIHVDNPNIGLVDFNKLALVRYAGSTIVHGFEIRSIDEQDVVAGEESKHTLTVSGPGVLTLLGSTEIGGAVVMPACGNIDGLFDGVRRFGFMDCCCFDFAGHGFSAPAPMRHRQDDPDYPWEPEDPPEWPDPAAYRLWGKKTVAVTAGANEVQTVSLGSSIVSGYFTITFEGSTSANVTSPWSASKFKAALDAIIEDGSVSVTGSGTNASPYVVTFNGGSVRGRNVGRLKINHATLNHPPQTSTVTTITTGTKGNYKVSKGRFIAYKTFTTTVDKELVAFINMSRTGEVFIDGVSIYTQTSASSAKSTQAVPVTLPAGDHCIVAETIKPKEGGLGWFMMSLAEADENSDGGWSIGAPVARTDATWLHYYDPDPDADPPGMNVGEIVTCIVDDNTTAANFTAPDGPSLDGITLDFDEDVDSNGVAWVDELNWDVTVNTGLLDVLTQLAEQTGVTFDLDPDTLVLSIWQTKGTDRTGSVVYARARDTGDASGGILALTHAGEAGQASSLQVMTQDGLFAAADPTAIANMGIRRLGVTMGATREFKTLTEFLATTFAQVNKRWAISLSTWGPTGLVPVIDYDVLDVITAPASILSGTDWRVQQIQMQLMPSNRVIWTASALEEV